MIKLGFQFVTISSDLRLMDDNARKIIQEIKLIPKNKNNSY